MDNLLCIDCIMDITAGRRSGEPASAETLIDGDTLCRPHAIDRRRDT